MSTSSETKRLPSGKDEATRRRIARNRRHFRLRKKIEGTPERPRLAVFRSARHIHAQLIDDLHGHTVAAASTLEPAIRAMDGDKSARGAKAGELLAERAIAAGVDSVVFDRGGNKYHGRIAAFADAARKGGLKF